jgi:sulfate/thiosulfate-binding protein
MMRARWGALALAAVTATALLAACGSDKGDKAAGTSTSDGAAALPAAQLSLVAYSTPQEAYTKIIEAFRATPRGRNITFTQSYGASGDQSRAVESGLGADVVAFSLEPDMTRLVKAGLVAPDWNAGPEKGMVTDSVVVLAVRKGNPKAIKDWAALIQPGTEVITPNPFTSGGARWNVLAAYGAQVKQSKSPDEATAYLRALFKNVAVQDDSARASLQTFANGKGDVLLAYENEAVFARQKGQSLDYVIPDQTILIENPVAVTTKTRYPEQAKAFVDFLRTTQAQRIFADNGYRPVTSGVAKAGEFKTPKALFTIADLGGWADAGKRFFDPEQSIMLDIERQLGVSVVKK